MKEAYISKAFRPETEELIQRASSIIEDYEDQGFSLTLRQLYYQFVARGIIENSERSYKRLGSIITDARMAGLISWTAIEDRGRGVSSWLVEEDEQEVFKGIEYSFALDFWERQNVYVEAWVEKEALKGVLQRPCERWRVPYMACKGYLSASEAWRSGLRYRTASRDRAKVVLIHLGDHDPSGIDMTRDNQERVDQFSWAEVEIRRIALNMNQIEEYRPPPNPAKLTDSRASDYVNRFGYQSWELDALEPSLIDRLVDKEIRSLVDPDVWAQTQDEEAQRREVLRDVYDRWDDIAEFLAA
ncbi:MAG: hypothetical protein AAGA08_16795 [Pseudomonadota bacterium]